MIKLNYVGRIGVGRVERGSFKVGMQVTIAKGDDTTYQGKIAKLYTHVGLKKVEVEEVTPIKPRLKSSALMKKVK